MNRRDALRTLASSAAALATSRLWIDVLAQQDWKPRVLTPSQDGELIALTEAVIPATDTPGAKAALVNRFIDQVLADAPEKQRTVFIRGLTWVTERSRTEFGKEFAAASPEQQTALLTRLADPAHVASGDETGAEFFRALKSMTISGYYSTEVGLRQELGDDGRMVLAKFEGCTHPEHQT